MRAKVNENDVEQIRKWLEHESCGDYQTLLDIAAPSIALAWDRMSVGYGRRGLSKSIVLMTPPPSIEDPVPDAQE